MGTGQPGWCLLRSWTPGGTSLLRPGQNSGSRGALTRPGPHPCWAQEMACPPLLRTGLPEVRGSITACHTLGVGSACFPVTTPEPSGHGWPTGCLARSLPLIHGCWPAHAGPSGDCNGQRSMGGCPASEGGDSQSQGPGPDCHMCSRSQCPLKGQQKYQTAARPVSLVPGTGGSTRRHLRKCPAGSHVTFPHRGTYQSTCITWAQPRCGGKDI